jgi:hypothetical protein
VTVICPSERQAIGGYETQYFSIQEPLQRWIRRATRRWGAIENNQENEVTEQFLKELSELATSLGLRWAGTIGGRVFVDESGVRHPRRKIVFRCQSGEEEAMAEQVVRTIAAEHGPGWFRTVGDSLVYYMADNAAARQSPDSDGYFLIGTYYAHQNATEAA